jgi:phage gpG-like protein
VWHKTTAQKYKYFFNYQTNMANIIKSINFGYAKENLLRDTARMAAIESVKFFKESFRKGGFTDTSFQQWPGKKSPLGGKKTMYGTGALMQSIQKTEETERRVVVSSGTPYSETHNEGGNIIVTAQMKKYWWAQYYKLSGKIKTTRSGKQANTASNRKLNAKAEYCRRMALMKVGSKIKIPKRQFMGESQTLMNELDRQLQAKIAEYWEKS